jgi:hypothetical protein
MKNLRLLTLAAIVLVLGAGCATATPTPLAQTPPVQTAPVQTAPVVPPTAVTPAPKEVAEYQITCQSAAGMTSDLKASVDKLLTQNGWHELQRTDRSCQNGSVDGTVLVLTDNCTNTECTKAALINVDTKRNTLKVLSTEDTSEMLGAAAILLVVKWTPEVVSYRHVVYAPDGPCVESDIKDKVSYEDVEISLATGARKVVKTCKYQSCDLGTLTCTETP